MSDRRVPPGGGFVIAMIPAIMFWLVILLFALASKGHAQGVLPASTGCIGDTITTRFRDDISRDTLAMQQLDAHEAVHRAQMKSVMDSLHVGCAEALWTLTSSPLVNLMSEVPAYRAQAEWLRAHVLNFDEAAYYDWVAKGLYNSYLPFKCIPSADSVGAMCRNGKRPFLPYDFIHAYLTLGRNPGLPPNDTDFPPLSLLAADSLLENVRP